MSLSVICVLSCIEVEILEALDTPYARLVITQVLFTFRRPQQSDILSLLFYSLTIPAMISNTPPGNLAWPRVLV